MRFFERGRGGENYLDDEELEERPLKLKDLRSENKRKRKEPPRPWGKKERMVVLIVLLVTAIVSAVLAFGASGGSKIHFKLSKPNLNLNFLNIFKEETIIIEKK